jgi:hypothetical protein
MFTAPPLTPLSVLARQLRVPVRWLRAEAEAGRLPCVRAEKQILFDPEVVYQVLRQRAAAAPAAAASGAPAAA